MQENTYFNSNWLHLGELLTWNNITLKVQEKNQQMASCSIQWAQTPYVLYNAS